MYFSTRYQGSYLLCSIKFLTRILKIKDCVVLEWELCSFLRDLTVINNKQSSSYYF